VRALLLKILLHGFARLPLRTTHKLATWLGQRLGERSRLVKVTRTNIGLCFPQLTKSEQDQLIRQSVIETCKTFSELGALWLWPVTRVLELVRTVSGETHLQQALQQSQGVILLTPHLGAWEMAGLYASSRYPLTALYRPPKLSGLHHLIHTARERAGGHFVPTDSTGVRALYQALRQGHIAGILPDQVPNEGAGRWAPFWGIPAYTMVLVARLARKTNATILFTYAERLPHGQGFHIHFRPTSPLLACDDLEVAVTALNQGIQACIQHCPFQYQWGYKRFKAGGSSFY